MVVLPIVLTFALFFGSFLPGWQGAPRAERFELRAGYGQARNNAAQPTGFQMIPALPSMSVPLTAPFGPDWLRGHIAWQPELFFAELIYPYHRPLFGVAPVAFSYVWEPLGRWSPYLAGGFGGVYGRINRPETGSRYNFLFHAGLGARYAWSDRMALILEFREIHISNGGTNARNSGIDSHLFLAGVSWRR